MRYYWNNFVNEHCRKDNLFSSKVFSLSIDQSVRLKCASIIPNSYNTIFGKKTLSCIDEKI